MKKISFKYKEKFFFVEARKVGFFGKGVGLMFKSREKAKALLFEFKKPTRMKIHSYFVSFYFLAVWLDDKNRVIEIKKVKPSTFSVSPRKTYSKLIEIPYNKKYVENIKSLVDD